MRKHLGVSIVHVMIVVIGKTGTRFEVQIGFPSSYLTLKLEISSNFLSVIGEYHATQPEYKMRSDLTVKDYFFC